MRSIHMENRFLPLKRDGPQPSQSALNAPCAYTDGSGKRTLGHPIQATLDAITATGAQVWRTDQHGTVTITFQGGVPAVVADR
jgi:hypothetical protein